MDLSDGLYAAVFFGFITEGDCFRKNPETKRRRIEFEPLRHNRHPPLGYLKNKGRLKISDGLCHCADGPLEYSTPRVTHGGCLKRQAAVRSFCHF